MCPTSCWGLATTWRGGRYAVSDDPVADVPTGPAPDRAGLAGDLARDTLARAKADARRRGARVGSPDGGRSGAARRDRQPARQSAAGPDDRDPQLVGAAIRRIVEDRGW